MQSVFMLLGTTLKPSPKCSTGSVNRLTRVSIPRWPARADDFSNVWSVIAQGDVWWADLPDPVGSAPGFRRPVVVVQGEAFNRSRIDTVVCVPLTSNLRWVEAPGNVQLGSRSTGLPRDSVANVSQIVRLIE